MTFDPIHIQTDEPADTLMGAADDINQNFADLADGLELLGGGGVEAHEASYDHLNIPSPGESNAITGNTGTPSALNPYLTQDDPSTTDARTPLSHGSLAHSTPIGGESQITFSTSTGHNHNGTGSTRTDHSDILNAGTNSHDDIDDHIEAAAPHSEHATLSGGMVPATEVASGTPGADTYRRGDGLWVVLSQGAIDAMVENWIVMMAWDIYAQDIAFDDIYIDDFTDQTGVDTGNSTGSYDSDGSYYQPYTLSGQTVDVATSQVNCSEWAEINSATVTQSTPGDVTVSQIYHAVSFDNKLTWKVFKSGSWTAIARDNGGTWQYSNAGSWTNASSNTQAQALIQATDQTAYQWVKGDVDAMSSANWEASGGWSTSVTTLDWATRLVNGVTADSPNNSETDATSTLSSNGTTASATQEYGSYAAFKAFDGSNTSTAAWISTGSAPQNLMYDFGAGVSKIINQYRICARNDAGYSFITEWKLQGSNDTNAAVGDAETANGWTTIDTRTGVTPPGQGAWTSYFTCNNVTAYRKYRFRCTAYSNDGYTMSEVELVEATTSTATPSFTRVSFNYDTEVTPLDVRTNGWEASVNDPATAYCVLDIEPVDSISIGTDLRAWVSIDDGAHYEEITLSSAPFREIGAHDFIRGDIDSVTPRADKTMRFKITSHNGKLLKLHAIGGGVKY